MISKPSPNHDARPTGQTIDLLLLHYTGMRSGIAALDRLRDSAAKVSAHYLIEEDGRVFALVPEARRAWHAGVAFWSGARDINARSIGIELVNPGHEWGYRRFPSTQMESLLRLARGILARHAIPANRVLGHSDVAPTRKQDPGELFDWSMLASQGIGVWPGERPSRRGQPTADAEMFDRLSRIGYDVAAPEAAIMAFQRHFRPVLLDGRADAECAEIADALLGA